MPRLRLLLPVMLLLAFVPTPGLLAQDLSPADGPVFIAHDVAPTITNSGELSHVLRRVYPSGYRDTGLDVTAILWVYVARDGTVGAFEVLKSNGYGVFDRAAEQVVSAMLFEPALRDGEPLAI
jgi:TonB family protein